MDDSTLPRADDGTMPRISADHTHSCPTCGLAVSVTQRTCPVDNTPIAHSPGYVLDGKYEFVELIGSGGMGVIYKARQIILNRPVAVKMMHSHMMSDKALMRFQREGKAGSTLSHPNITSVLDFAISKHGQPYMVMEFEVGLTLSEMIEVRGALDQEFVLDAIVQICQGLAHAHERRVLHRDLKPSNLMVIQRTDDVPLIKILDFGIAKILDGGNEKAKTITKTGETMGSPPYMSPEQAISSDIDQRADLYSLGCVMFEALAGTPPFVAENTFNIMMAHAHNEPPTLREASLGNQYPSELERIVRKLLAKKPEDRYQSAKELERELQRFRTGQISSGAEIKRGRPRTFAIAAAMLVGLMLVGGLAWFLPGILSKPRSQNNITSSTNSTPPTTTTNVTASTGSVSLNTSSGGFNLTDGTSGTAGVTTEGSTNLVDAPEEKHSEAEWEAAEGIGRDIGKKEIQKYFKAHPDTTTIKLGSKEINDSDLSEIAKYTDCQALFLPGNHIKGPGLANLRAMKNLNKLALTRNEIQGDALKPLAGLTNLRELDLGFNEHFSGEDFRHFGKENKLIALNLQETGITDDGLKALCHVGSILNLGLAGTQVSENGIRSVCAIHNLGTVDLTKTNLNKSKLAYLCKNKPGLTALFIGNTDIDDSSIPDLMSLQNLIYLDVSATRITPKGILQLGQLPRLTNFYCGGCNAFEAVGRLHITRPNLAATESARGHEAE